MHFAEINYFYADRIIECLYVRTAGVRGVKFTAAASVFIMSVMMEYERRTENEYQ